MGSFELLNVNNKNLWHEYLGRLPVDKQDVYFTPEYYSLYEKNGDGEANCFIFEKDGNIALYPFLKNSVNQLGYSLNNEFFDIQGAYGYNGVLTNSFDFNFIDQFYKSFDEYCNEKNIIAEFTRFHPLLGNHEFSKNHMQVIIDRETVALDLTLDYESIWLNEYSSKNRNMIRKAEKEGYIIEVIEAPSISQIDSFIDIYTYSMKMANASEYYYFNRDFFYNTFIYLKEHTLLFNVLNNNKEVVCTSIFFTYGDFFHYHLSGRNEKASNVANNFLLDEAIKFAKNKGAKLFYLGGGRSSDPNDSLLKFKGNFSENRVPFYVGKKIHNKAIYDQIIEQWIQKDITNKSKFSNRLLKYRY